jgi:hypothetical protein
MTETEWLVGTEVSGMLSFLGKKASFRKRRLFACACVRRIWHLLDDPRSRRAVEVAEALADGKVNKETAKCVQREAGAASRATPKGRWYPADAAAICILQSTEDISTAARTATAASHAGVTLSAERTAQAVLVRDIFGNPFRPLSLEPAWMTPTVLNLAQAAYDNRLLPSGLLDNARLAVLADALEEGGCADGELLEHLRSAGPHVRGCWPVDLILNKE